MKTRNNINSNELRKTIDLLYNQVVQYHINISKDTNEYDEDTGDILVNVKHIAFKMEKLFNKIEG